MEKELESKEIEEKTITPIKEQNKRKFVKRKHSFRRLSKELSKKPEILNFILYLQKCLINKKKSIKKLKIRLEKYRKNKKCDVSCQTGIDSVIENDTSNEWKTDSELPWKADGEEKAVSIADQVKEAAESALQQTGMVYEATSGLYYDYNTGYYYNAELGLYYHGSTGCYYYFDKEQNQFVFHSQADTSQFSNQAGPDFRPSSENKGKHKKEKRQGKKREPKQDEEVTEETTPTKPKKTKVVSEIFANDSSNDGEKKTKKIVLNADIEISNDDALSENEKIFNLESDLNGASKPDIPEENCSKEVSEKGENQSKPDNEDLEDGECSESEEDNSEDSSSDSDDSVAVNYPPCMRIIVQETETVKLKVGTLFLLTKDGGTLGREGSKHSVIIPEENVSRHHLTFSYNEDKGLYFVADMGSRNGTVLNGRRMSAAQQESELMEVVHGSIIQLAGTKLLCHIHKGNFTCGHCEPGLLIQDDPPPESKPKDLKPLNLKKEHRKEIRRLKVKYKINPFPPKDEDAAVVETQLPEGYEDKARKRREEVGSQHHGAKTEQANLEKSISSTNKGFKMLQKMGWNAGEGLGKEAQGAQNPVPLVSNIGTSGLGNAPFSVPGSLLDVAFTKNKKQKSKIWIATQKRFNKLPTPKAFLEEEDDDEDDLEG